jgi:hypothetical protein
MPNMNFSLMDMFSADILISYVYMLSLLVVILSSVTLLVHLNRIFWREVPKGFWGAVFQTPLVRIAVQTKAFWIMIGSMLINKVAEYFLGVSVK